MFSQRRRLAGAIAASIAGVVLVGCGSTSASTSTQTVRAAAVVVQVTSPANGTVINSTNVTIRGTVTPANATVQIDGHPAAVGNGVFTGSAPLQRGKTTIDVIGSSSSLSPGSTDVVITRPGSGRSKRLKATTKSPVTSSTNSATPGVASEQPTSGSGVPSNTTPCGGGLSVGPDTTCTFAQNVEASYQSNGTGTYDVYSPVTQDTYSMTCNPGGDGTEIFCTGGSNASVYFPG